MPTCVGRLAVADKHEKKARRGDIRDRISPVEIFRNAQVYRQATPTGTNHAGVVRGCSLL